MQVRLGSGLLWALQELNYPGGLPRGLSGEEALEKQMTTHSSVLAGEILWTEEPSRLQAMGWQSATPEQLSMCASILGPLRASPLDDRFLHFLLGVQSHSEWLWKTMVSLNQQSIMKHLHTKAQKTDIWKCPQAPGLNAN